MTIREGLHKWFRSIAALGLCMVTACAFAVPGTVLLASEAINAPIWGTGLTYEIRDSSGIHEYIRGGDKVAKIDFDELVGPFFFCTEGSPQLCALFPAERLLEASLHLKSGDVKFNLFDNVFGSLDSLSFRFYDVLLVNVPGATPLTETTITMQHKLSGSIASDGGTYHFVDQFGIGPIRTDIANALNDLFGASAITSVSYDGLQGNFVDPDTYESLTSPPGLSPWTGSYTVDANITFRGSFAYVPFFSNFHLFNGSGIDSMDFSHTSSVSVFLPSGVTAGSASGVFLTEQLSVPEPSSWLLVSIALLPLATYCRRRRQVLV